MKTRRGPAGRGPSRKSRSLSRPVLERFEDRLLMTAFTVSNTSDAGAGSLRQAILDSNASATALPNQIVFSVGAGLQVISPASPLPSISQQVTIDGTTAAGYDPANPKPVVEIRGNNPTNSAGPAFTLAVPGVNIKALVIDRFTGAGVVMNGGKGSVTGSWIGVDATGGVLAKNTGEGITVASPNNTVGGTTPAGRNVISGNFAGIHVTGGVATANLIQGNFVGTDSTGFVKLGNTFDGISIDTAGNTIGGVTTISNNVISGAGNLISGNGTGLRIANAGSNNNIVQGNYIGTDASGLGTIGNTFDGLDLDSVRNTQVGGNDPTLRNIISGNGFVGINVSNSSSTNTRIQGNYIGVGSNGTSPLGNGAEGIIVNGAINTVIGGATLSPTVSAPQLGNIIAYSGKTFSSSDGVLIRGGANNGVSNGILTNSIFSNGGLGIHLLGGNQGVLPPTLVSVQSGGAQTRIVGSYFGQPSTPYRLQFFSNQAPDPSGAGEGMNFLGEIDVTTDSLGNASFTTVLNKGAAVGDFVSATATQQVLQVNNTSQFSTDLQVTQALVTDLAVSTTVPATPPLLNQNYTYTITVTNNGPNDATGVTLADTIPTSSTFVSASGGTFAAGVLTDNIGNLANGSSVTVTITVKPTSIAGTFTNTAVVGGAELDTSLANNTSTTTGTVTSNADLSATLTVSANPAPVGSPVTFTLVVGNNGPSTTNKTTATVTLPASLTNVVVTQQDQGTYSLSGNLLTINIGILPASGASTITFVGTPSTTGTLQTVAAVSSELTDSNPANDTSTVNLVVANAADLALAISEAPNPVLLGQELFYTVTLTNNGPSQATSPVIYDTLPAGLTFDIANSSAGGNGVISLINGVVTATMNALPAGGVYTIVIAAMPSVSGQVINTATVADPDTINPVEIDPDPTNNTASTTSQVNPADIGVSILNPADPLLIGTQATYQILVTNNGPAAATNVLLADNFGANATIVASSAGTFTGPNLKANLGTLAAGASTTITITINPTASGPLIDQAAVSSDEVDPNPDNNTASSSNLVSPVDLGVTMTASPNPVLIGGQVVYLVTITNAGPTTANNVLFNDVLPAGAIYNSATSSQGTVAPTSTTTVSGNLGTLAPGASATVVVLVTTDAVSTATNTAAVSSDGFDTNTANNTASASVSVINLPGTIVVGTPLIFVPENGGFATITLDRVGGTLGTVTVNYDTSDFTAVAGVNYTATHAIATFLDGQTTATITIPVLDDFMVDGNHGFYVTLSNPTGGASVGADNVAAVVVTNTDRDTIPPIVTGLIAIPNGQSLNGFVIFFDKALDPTRAGLVDNYHVYLTDGGRGQTQVPLAAAVYSPLNNSVTLVPTAPLASNRFYHIIANGSYGSALTDASGNVLYGSAGLGTNYDVYYGQGNSLQYIDSQSNSVAITLTGGGTMAMFRGASGDAAALNLFNIVPHKSTLSGSVKKLSKAASGQTSINTIAGLGKFGDVKSNLTTPPFYVGFAPVTYIGINGPTTVSAVAIKPAAVVTGKKTPRGVLAM